MIDYYFWETNNEKIEEYIEKTKEEYFLANARYEGAKAAYFEAVSSYVNKRLIEKKIIPKTQIIIHFDDCNLKCIYEGCRNGKIFYRPYTKKGEPYKTAESTNWENMIDNIERYKVEN